MTREDAKALIHFIMSMLDGSDRSVVRRELAEEFFSQGIEERERDKRLPVIARTEIVKRSPKDER